MLLCRWISQVLLSNSNITARASDGIGLANSAQTSVDEVLALIANEWYARGHGAPDYQWLESLGQSLTQVCESKTASPPVELGSIESEQGDALECKPSRGCCQLGAATTSVEIVAGDVAEISANDFKTVAQALYQSSNGAAILDAKGGIQYGNAALLSLSAAGTFSLLGRSLLSVLQVSIDDFAGLLGRVAVGIPWSGRVMSHGENPQSYWISLSPSPVLGAAGTIIALVDHITHGDSETEQDLRQQAMHDKLTGLPNRRFFYEYLERLLPDLKLTGVGADICFIDLDDFKPVNDNSGHADGDCLLHALGERIQAVFGPHAFVSRFGGDEFAAVLVDGESGPGLDPYEGLRQALREPFPLSEAEAQMTVSIGVARFPEHGSEIDSLMRSADAAMYAAKSLGKNRVVLFSDELQADMTARQQVRSKLRRALDDGEIELWFQPKVHAHSHALVGCEALARWRTPGGEYIPPNHFIPVAEQTGLISLLGNRVFQLAAEQAVCWRARGFDTQIAVNVSPLQLRHPRFVEQLRQILEQTTAKPSWFELEITENAVMEDVNHAVAVMNELTQLGFRIAIDDFGTGYSSLSYLKNFSIHTLKIDLSFVRDLICDQHSDAIVRSIISLGSGLDLTLVAEGVETEQQASFLRNAGCDILQGYLIGKPMPYQQLEHWLQTRSTSSVVSSGISNALSGVVTNGIPGVVSGVGW